MIAALYVESEGCYADLPGVDAWDEAREKFRTGDWDEYDEDGGEVQSVECDTPRTRLDPAFLDESEG